MESNKYKTEYKFHSITIEEEQLSGKAYYYKISGELCHHNGFVNSISEAEKEAREKIDEKFHQIDRKSALHRYCVMRDFESFVELLNQQKEMSPEITYQIASQLALASTLKYFTKEVLSNDINTSSDNSQELNPDNLQ
ncbi:conserved hypothetical protein [Trichormus variabilis ATCC 29413]|uniref:Uncharacterized protein n=2 Tax=Anabaena variabilis TaxID=264691 RepID=Q3MGS0_TRIV2|nr:MULTISPECIES: hypothetical protein [Nostocaceae]ABA19816.1 conserved hypothetical protein [Trichormus variabilis ATCC 29413]MBC1216293.1 hypothetical protein [Trichormus variabilis ARAD]MBC1258795.1 hypothetical protein [Trichormus variabilis V5]MBC1270452.1 hypothetical protein [Trichormus variabilis FSR]MBC1302524.1 hypothetical protein [Trichormus variabilis N2B]